MNHTVAPIVIGIGGVTCGGKSTLCRILTESLSATVKVVTLSMDDYYMDDLYIELKKSIVNWDCLEAIDFEKLTKDLDVLLETTEIEKLQDVTEQVNGGTTTINNTRHSVVENSAQSKVEQQNIMNGSTKFDPVVILLDGIMIYQYEPLQKYFNLRYFITLSKDVSLERRLKRRYCYATGEEIIFDPFTYFENYAWPCYLDTLRDFESQIEESSSEDLKFLNGSSEISVNTDLVLRDITDLVNKARLQSLGS